MTPYIVPHPPHAPDIMADDLARERRMEGLFAPSTDIGVPGAISRREIVMERRSVLDSRRRRHGRLAARR
ncbi:MAG TPA: hypothetical protein PKV67_07215 [Hyphomonas sp.]|nr:hypothetical protein [Hyphomonas sp.]HRJ00552.1 hypothetical protein [Hyphomonas sp.]HRK69525.1 hypothetical protein [Hyphomonas sp.]